MNISNDGDHSNPRHVSQQSSSKTETHAPAGRENRVVLISVALSGFCAFLNLYMTQPLLPLLQGVFHASAQAVSMTVGVSVLAVAISAPLVGMVADAVGRKRVIVASLLGMAVPTLLGATAQSLNDLLAWRFLQGLFIPGVVATTMAYISEETPPGATSITMATYVTGTVVGGFCGRFIAGFAATHWRWQGAFLTLGSLTFIGALATWWLLPRSRRFVRQSDPRESLQSIWTHLHNKQLLATYLVGFHVLFSLVGAFTYVSFYLAAPPFHLNSSALGSLFFVYLIGAAITPIAGRLIDRFGNRRTLACALLLAASGILLTLPPIMGLVVLGLGMCCTGVFICQAAASGQVGKVAGGARSSAAGLYVSLYYAGGFAGASIPGLLWDHGGWPTCVALVVGLQVMTAGIAWITWKDVKAPVEMTVPGLPD